MRELLKSLNKVEFQVINKLTLNPSSGQAFSSSALVCSTEKVKSRSKAAAD